MIEILLKGQVRGGKNHMMITKTGHRYPNKSWALWRDDALRQIADQGPHELITTPSTIWVQYFAGDKRKRDVPGMLDALYHCLERALVVKDDFFLDHVIWTPGYDKADPRAHITINERGNV